MSQPELDTDPLLGTLGLDFDHSPSWDPTTPAPDPAFTFDQSPT